MAPESPYSEYRRMDEKLPAVKLDVPHFSTVMGKEGEKEEGVKGGGGRYEGNELSTPLIYSYFCRDPNQYNLNMYTPFRYFLTA